MDRLVGDLVGQSRRELHALATEATATLREILRSSRSDSARLQALRLVLDSVGVLKASSEFTIEPFGAEVDLNQVILAIVGEERRVVCET